MRIVAYSRASILPCLSLVLVSCLGGCTSVSKKAERPVARITMAGSSNTGPKPDQELISRSYTASVLKWGMCEMHAAEKMALEPGTLTEISGAIHAICAPHESATLNIARLFLSEQEAKVAVEELRRKNQDFLYAYLLKLRKEKAHKYQNEKIRPRPKNNEIEA